MKLLIFLICFVHLNVLLASKKIVSDHERRSEFNSKLLSDIIDIDGAEDEDGIESSGDDDDDDGGSADYDDDFIYSGDSTVESSVCETLRRELSSNKLLGSFVPRCTSEGHFAPTQCHTNIGACWCVDRSGREILGSRKQAPDYPLCSGTASQTTATLASSRASQAPPRHPSGSVVDTGRKSTTEATTNDDGIIWIQSTQETFEPDNKLDQIPNGNDASIEFGPADTDTNEINSGAMSEPKKILRSSSIMNQPGILAGIIGGAVVGLLCAVLLIMFIVYRMKRKDDLEYMIDNKPPRAPLRSGYTKEFDNRDVYT